MKRGRFITLEGGEGAGKSTQLARLKTALVKAGHECMSTREPGGSAGAEQIRDLIVTGSAKRWDAITESLLITAARRDHVERLIRPALKRGDWVLCDRFVDSTIAYQGYGRGMPLTLLNRLRRLSCERVMPDLTIILDIPVEDGLARAALRKGSGETRFESEGVEFHNRLRDGFHKIATENPDRCVIVDASADLDSVTALVRSVVRARLPDSGL
jgi:dTMP kinase